MKTIYTIPVSIILGIFLLFAHTANAASLFFVPATGTLGVGTKITVDLKIDSAGLGVNAGQATIRFPKETLQVDSIDKTDSIFTFWLTEPTFSNQDGVITFAGGTPYGISGASMQVLRVTFISKGSGTAPISLTDTAITASDGSGTNILSKTGQASFTVSPTSTGPTAAPVVATTSAQIIRAEIPASGLPSQPNITVPLYPDQTHWYNAEDVFTARWTLPRDITGISTALNKEPNFTPAAASEGLFESKSFAALSDGIWFLHVRFQNSEGWGQTAHYRISVDTKSPVPFKITTVSGDMGNAPTQTLQFHTSDTLSGVSIYQINVNNKGWITIPSQKFNGEYVLTFNDPGKHHIIVRATDYAGNSIENSIDHELIPIASPAFTFVNQQIFSDEPTGLNVKGTTIASSTVALTLKQGDTVIDTAVVTPDALNNWEYTFSDALRNGNYVIEAQSKDPRGAVSLVVSSPSIGVTNKPIFQLGFISLHYQGVAIILLLVLIAGFGSGYWFYRMQREKTILRLDVVESDAAKVFKIVETNLQKLEDAQKSNSTINAEFLIEKLKKNIEHLGKYLKEEIRRAKK